MEVASDNPIYDSRDKCNAIIVTADNALLYGCQTTNIPRSVIRINQHAFLDITTLKSIFIHKDVTQLYDQFNGCSGLESIVVEEGNPVYDSRNGCNAVIHKNNVLLAGCKNTVIPSTVTQIGSDAFKGCSQLESIHIPESVTIIHDSAFEHCTALASVHLPSALTQLGSSAFSGCSSLPSITFPASLTEMGYGVLNGCESLKEVHSQILDPMALGELSLCNDEVYQAATLFVPTGTLEIYQMAAGWKEFFQIKEEAPLAVKKVYIKPNSHTIHPCQYYDVNGRLLSSPVRGLNIVRYTDGRTQKIIVK